MDLSSVSGISSSIQALTDILQKTAASHGDLTGKLLKIGAQNTIDLNKLQTIGQVIDTYA